MAKRPTTDDDKTTPFIRDDEPAPKPARPLGAPATPAVIVSDLAAVGQTPIVPKKLIVGTSFNNAKLGGGMPRWGVVLITVVVLLHVGFIGGSWASSIWSIERLDRPKGASFDIAIAPAPPPPPPPPPGGQKPQTEIKVKPKKTVKEVVQLTKVEKQERAPELTGSTDGVVGGEVGGVSDGVVGGDVTAPPPPPPPPPPPAPPQNVPPTLLEGSRIAGDKNIIPNDVTKTEIQRSGKDKIVGSYKLCITVDGGISSITQLKSTGFAAYDNKIQAEMRNWRYKPYLVNGRAVPVCTAVTFVYSQK
jgi:periplasmic protein TonB